MGQETGLKVEKERGAVDMASIIFKSGERTGETVTLSEGDIQIGRHASCNIVVADPLLSQHHAVLREEPEGWWIYNINSSNGTAVNGTTTEATKLNDGDEITVGNAVLLFRMNGEAISESTADVPVEITSEEAARAHDTTKGKTPSKASADTIKPPKAHVKPSANAPHPIPSCGPDDVALIQELNEAYSRITEQLSRVIVGQDKVIEQVLVSILCRGHALLVGVPGLAKTLLVSTLSHVLDLSFKRIQFTPDLMPSDITGTTVLEEDQTSGRRSFRFVKGPLFSNMVLADEINRTPPKTQAALLEAMQEHVVTVGETSHHLPAPFFVLATQNPIEQEGTYPLPEAQLDRFMFNIVLDYPTAEEESRIIKQVTGTYKAQLEAVLNAEDLLRLQQVVRRVPVADHVIDFARNIVRATRPEQPNAPEIVKQMIGWGAGPRAGIYLILAAKANAILHGSHHATTEDVIAMALPVLRHRVLTTFNAEAAGIKSDEVIRELIAGIHNSPEIDI